ncbi:hypothetical protein [Streptomyces sp. NPDC093707]|uniref:hypothetical protein n=1 Tax=Streptomyces sp. NPDC093707 TaxID=3154984 RepID=UPI00344DA2C9
MSRALRGGLPSGARLSLGDAACRGRLARECASGTAEADPDAVHGCLLLDTFRPTGAARTAPSRPATVHVALPHPSRRAPAPGEP